MQSPDQPPASRFGRHAGTLFAVAAGLTAAAAFVHYSIAGRDAQVLADSVSCGPGRRRSVALTFDDGPGPGSLQVAGILARFGIRATFFQCGRNVIRYPKIAAALAAAGHEIGNHTFSHRRLPPRLGWRLNLLGPATVAREFFLAQRAIIRATGVQPRLMRAPYGLRWHGMRRVQQELGLLDVSWTAIGHDWAWDGPRVAAHLLRHTRPGAILCLHDGRDTRPAPNIGNTLIALEQLIPGLLRLGYHFETVTEILH